MSGTAYETDFFAWTQEQATLLRQGKLDEVDRERLAEEIEDVGKSERRAMEARLEVLLLRLLKWQFQPAYRGRSWRLTIREQRLRLAGLLEDNPSLRGTLTGALAKTYRLAALGAERETGLEGFPPECPYTLDQALDPQFLPG